MESWEKRDQDLYMGQKMNEDIINKSIVNVHKVNLYFMGIVWITISKFLSENLFTCFGIQV